MSSPNSRQTAPPTQQPIRRQCTDAELQNLEQQMIDKFKWTHRPRPFQMEAVRAQLKGLDAIVHAGTGLGKTAIAAGPHAHPSAKGKVTLMVSPLLALHDEMVCPLKIVAIEPN